MAERETEKVIYTDGGRRGGGATVAIVLLIIALLVILFLVFGRGLLDGRATKTINADVHVSGGKSG
jgi:hypothetical protein